MSSWDVFHSDRLEVERGLSAADVVAAVAKGDLHDDDLARPAGTSVPWARLLDVPELAAALAAGPATVEEPPAAEPVDYLHDTVASPPDDDSAELAGEIRAALRELRLEYREVFVLFHEQGQPYEDIARVMSRPVGTIKTWLHRARLEILDRLRKRGMVPDDQQQQQEQKTRTE